MSLYDMMHGTNPLAGDLMYLLGLLPGEFGRFRDCYLVDRQPTPHIAVFTRCGGGNREQHQDVIDWARSLPGYLSDYDDDYDSTYCTFEFAMPDTDEAKQFVDLMLETCKQLTPEQRERVFPKSFRERSEKVLELIKGGA